MSASQTGLGMGSPPQMKGPQPILRGVVINVYFADDPGAREDRSNGRIEAKCVSVDILTYGGPNRGFLARVPVVARRHGLNDYDLDPPLKPSTLDLSTGLAPVLAHVAGFGVSDPRDLDGDHVLVEFFEGDPNQPFVRDSLPHPRAKQRQLRSDGFPKKTKLRGVELSIDDNGNVRLDTTQASDGGTDIEGEEAPSDDATHGRLTVLVGQHTTLAVQGVSPDGSVKTFELTLKGGEYEVRLQDGASFKVTGNGDGTVVTIGNGGSSAVRGERLEALYGELKATFDTHAHVDGFGSTGPTPTPAPAWGANILSTGVKIPDT